MQSLLVFGPLAAFFIAYKVAGVYVATAVLMGAMAVVLAVDYLRTRRIPPMHAISAVLIFALGLATLLLHDERFIKLKPTAFFWVLGLAFLGSVWIGKQPLVQRMLEPGLGGERRLTRRRWVTLNFLWVLFYAALGAANLFVALHASTDTWVNFKLFGLTSATLVFVALQFVWIFKCNEPVARV